MKFWLKTEPGDWGLDSPLEVVSLRWHAIRFDRHLCWANGVEEMLLPLVDSDRLVVTL